MSGINKVILVGRLGADPEVKDLQNNQKVARLSVATSDTWTDKQGEKQERTEWHRVVLWGKLADLAGKYLAKGRQVYLEGRLQTRQYEKNGEKRYTTEVVANVVQFLGNKEGANPHQSSDSADPTQYAPAGDDDIPF